MKSGIYQIVNKNNKRKYLGCSSNIDSRLSDHKVDLRRGKHTNEELQNDYNELGIDKFYFGVVEYCKEEELKQKENDWLNAAGIAWSEFYNKSKKSNYSSEIGGRIEEEKVIAIREKYQKDSVSQYDLADEYGFNRSTVKCIVKGKYYTDCGGPIVDEDQWSQKLTKSKVKEIRNSYKPDQNNKEKLAKKYNVSESHIYDILVGNQWSHAGGPIIEGTKRILSDKQKEKISNSLKGRETSDLQKERASEVMKRKHKNGDFAGEKSGESKLTWGDVEEIRNRYENESVTQKELAEDYPVNQRSISKIVRKKSWKPEHKPES